MSSLPRKPHVLGLLYPTTLAAQSASTSASASRKLSAAARRRPLAVPREQLFELLQQATAGRAPDCAGAAAEREEPEGRW